MVSGMSENKFGEKDNNIHRTCFNSVDLIGLIRQTIMEFMFNPLIALDDMILVFKENGKNVAIDGSGKRIPFESLDSKTKDFFTISSTRHKSDYAICLKIREKSFEEILARPETLRHQAVARVYLLAKQFVEFVENKNLLKLGNS